MTDDYPPFRLDMRSTGERFRSLAAGESDFDPIRDEAAFEELVGKRRSRA